MGNGDRDDILCVSLEREGEGHDPQRPRFADGPRRDRLASSSRFKKSQRRSSHPRWQRDTTEWAFGRAVPRRSRTSRRKVTHATDTGRWSLAIGRKGPLMPIVPMPHKPKIGVRLDSILGKPAPHSVHWCAAHSTYRPDGPLSQSGAIPNLGRNRQR